MSLPGAAKAHLARSEAFLADRTQDVSSLIHAGLELRLALEALLMQMLLVARGRRLESSDYAALRSAQSIQARIYQTEGNQRVLDRRYEFFRLLLSVAGATGFPAGRVAPRKAFDLWQELSEFCHFHPQWTSDMVGAGEELLTAAADYVRRTARLLPVLPVYQDEIIKQLEENYIAGSVSSEEVLVALEERGAWGLVTLQDGSKRFASDLWGEQVDADTHADDAGSESHGV